jgi:hypothetical protein
VNNATIDTMRREVLEAINNGCPSITENNCHVVKIFDLLDMIMDDHGA